jgi:hypothetical protein
MLRSAFTDLRSLTCSVCTGLVSIGGAVRKIYSVVVGVALVLVANVAFADSDPSVIINKTTDPSMIITANSPSDPLVLDLVNGVSPTISFEYVGPTATSTLTELFVQLDNAQPLEEFSCQSDIFTGACGSFNTGISNDVGLIFTGGTITSGEDFYAQVPEPRSWILLLCSMLALVALGICYCREQNRVA